MSNQDWLATQFEAHRDHLRAVAQRMLGSHSEAEDVVQDAWLRMSRADTSEVDNLGGWLTTVVARASLDVLRSRKTRAEESLDAQPVEHDYGDDDAEGPEDRALLADAMGTALLVVLDRLTPSERIAFVLHDLFGMSFEDIGPIVGRSDIAARQLASRARRRVQGAATPDPDLARQRKVVDAFLAASRGGDLVGLLSVLDPNVVLRADAVAVLTASAKQSDGAPRLAPELRGAKTVAETFVGRAQAARAAIVAGAAGAAWAPDGTPRVAFAFSVVGERIVAIEIIADPAGIADANVTLLD